MTTPIIHTWENMWLDLQKPTKLSQQWKSSLMLNVVATYILPLSRYTNYEAIDSQVCFQRRSFANPVKPWQSTTESVGPLMGTNKAAWGVKLLLTTVWSYQAGCGGFCALLRTQHCCLPPCGWFCPLSASHPPPINFIRDITGVVKNHHKNQQC